MYFYLTSTAQQTSQATQAAQAGQPNMFTTIITFGVIFLLMYLFMIRPQKKREKEAQDMRQSIEVGHDIVTIGGIIGTVVSIKEDTVVIETSGDRSKIRIYRWAIQQNITPKE